MQNQARAISWPDVAEQLGGTIHHTGGGCMALMLECGPTMIWFGCDGELPDMWEPDDTGWGADLHLGDEFIGVIQFERGVTFDEMLKALEAMRKGHA